MAPTVVTDPRQMRTLARTHLREGRTIAFVPTMGYLHEGHMSLFRIGRKRGDVLVASIFVNPTQFGPNEDLDRYPRDMDGDLAKAESCGVDLVYAPEASAVYPEGFQTYVEVTELTRPLCGTKRPGHFRGVATVVSKLFHVVMPDLAVFGQKDYQQLKVIERMVRDLDMDIEIVSGPIVREEDGLAMSSRNAYLTESERVQATALFRGLSAAKAVFDGGERERDALLSAARRVMEAEPDIRLDYLELRDADSLREVHEITAPVVMAVAAYLGKTRLIDNMVFEP